MDDFHKIGSKVGALQKDYADLKEISSVAKDKLKQQRNDIDALIERVNRMADELKISDHHIQPLEDIQLDDLNNYIDSTLLSIDDRTPDDKTFDLNSIDYLIACLAGGIAVLLDFMVVKIPRNIKFGNDCQEGSRLTTLIDRIGKSKEGKESHWINVLETWFKVPYDKSLDPSIIGMYPKNHRAFSLAHDPSFSGLVWAMKDLAQGTFSYIDENGVLHMMKCRESDYVKLFYAPVFWLGHIISDIFTSQGIPIPGTSLLRLFNSGLGSDVNRGIGEIATYMYEKGYNLKHLATMSITNKALDLVISIYNKLIAPEMNGQLPLSEQEYIIMRAKRKKHRMLMISYSVATCGNIAKLYAYKGNTNALNLAVWYGFIKEAITEIKIQTSDDTIEKVIERRHVIDENFKRLDI